MWTYDKALAIGDHAADETTAVEAAGRRLTSCCKRLQLAPTHRLRLAAELLACQGHG